MNALSLTTGQHLPTLGLGTSACSPGEIDTLIKTALKVGYRHFDCALFYGNEREIGDALKKYCKEMDVKREDIFITSKLWCTYVRPDLVKIAFEKSLKDLQLDYIDLYLIHWPISLKPGDGHWPVRSDGAIDVDSVPHEETWKVLETLVDDGLAKSIGLSNFNRRQIDNILKHCRIYPANLQIEMHANFPNTKLAEYCKSVGISVTAYAPLGSPGAFPGATNLLTQTWVCNIAKKYAKTPAQVLLRYLLQRGVIVIPKSANPIRIEENIKIYDFQLTDDEMQTLHTSGLNERQFKVTNLTTSKDYPFSDDY